ncbi:YdbL [Shigella dysenteriae Sd197]|uniref:YdbL n=2 Tax=Shigella dysenteriae TaxID=622 RepID=Q32GE9_SHIDS|nr:YdbL [Shigella dysenteriae Sd197]
MSMKSSLKRIRTLKTCSKPVAIYFEVMMKRTLLIAVWAIGLMSDSAMALTLNEARSQGRVGETLNGYLVALQTDAETQALVKDINEARNHSYQQLAKQNNVSTVMPLIS